MKEIQLALATLADVFDEGIPFGDSLKNRFQANLEIRPYRVPVAALVGCALRHHLLFRFAMKDQEFNEYECRVLSLYFANHFFYKRLHEETLKAYLATIIPAETLAFGEEFCASHTAESLIPEDVSRGSNLFLSLRYNFPEWTLKIFQHFGFGPTYRAVKMLSRPARRYYALNPGVKMEQVLADKDFAPAPFFPESIVEYVGKTSIVKNTLYRSGALYPVKPFGRALIQKFAVEHPKQILIYDGNKNAVMARDLVGVYGSSIGLNVALSSSSNGPELQRLIKTRHYSNVNLFVSPNAESMGSAISVPQDLVFCCPESTMFDDIPYSPDYLLGFDKTRMDSLIEGESTALEACSKYVEVGGLLVYLVFTISKKEGVFQAQHFLAEHPEFERVEYKQHFPFEEASCQSAAFYCVFRKKDPSQQGTEPSPAEGE